MAEPASCMGPNPRLRRIGPFTCDELQSLRDRAYAAAHPFEPIGQYEAAAYERLAHALDVVDAYVARQAASPMPAESS